MKVVVIDPRRTATADIADLHLSISPDGDVALFNGLLAHLVATRSLSTRAISPATRRALPRLMPAPIARMADLHGRDRPAGHADPVSSSRLFASDRKGRHLLQPGRQPVVQRHRQGQRHHQLPSGDRPHRPPRHGTVLADRPAQCHGRARGRRACQHAGRPYGARKPDHRERVQRFWNAPRIADQTRSQGRRHVRGRRRRAHQGAVDHGDQSGRLHAGCRPR